MHCRSTASATRNIGSADDDLFIEAGGIDLLGFNIDHHLEQAASLSSPPDPTLTPSRTLILRNVAPVANEDELSSIFKVSSLHMVNHFFWQDIWMMNP
jgi:hypothetical protein